MHSLALPQRDDWIDFEAMCLRRSGASRPYLDSLADRVKAAYATYEERSRKPTADSALKLTREQAELLRKNYNLLSAGRPFNHIRDELLALAANRKCPMCGQREVAALDHYLPKAIFPEFSALCRNLVPVCPYCNQKKGDKLGDHLGRRFLHAYYDQLPDMELLVAEVVFETTIGVIFRICPPSDFTDPIVEDLRYHFDTLNLADCYTREALQELSDRAGTFDFQHSFNGGEVGLSRMLEVEARSVRTQRGLNSWKAALYTALARSREFCSGGYRLLLADY